MLQMVQTDTEEAETKVLDRPKRRNQKRNLAKKPAEKSANEDAKEKRKVNRKAKAKEDQLKRLLLLLMMDFLPNRRVKSSPKP